MHNKNTIRTTIILKRYNTSLAADDTAMKSVENEKEADTREI